MAALIPQWWGLKKPQQVLGRRAEVGSVSRAFRWRDIPLRETYHSPNPQNPEIRMQFKIHPLSLILYFMHPFSLGGGGVTGKHKGPVSQARG